MLWLVQATKEQCFHGKGGTLGKQGEKCDKAVIFKRLSSLLVSLKRYRSISYEVYVWLWWYMCVVVLFVLNFILF